MTTYPGTDWPVPCPNEGDEDACAKCWASSADATPYCTSDTYKEVSSTKPEPAQDGSLNPVCNPTFRPRFP